MDFVDVKYINLISSRLQKFKRVKNNLYNLRCPICGDSQKNKNTPEFKQQYNNAIAKKAELEKKRAELCVAQFVPDIDGFVFFSPIVI